MIARTLAMVSGLLGYFSNAAAAKATPSAAFSAASPSAASFASGSPASDRHRLFDPHHGPFHHGPALHQPLGQLPNHQPPCGNATKCCESLALVLRSTVSFASDHVYINQTSGLPEAGYWAVQEESLSPACRVTPRTAQDVSVALRVLVAGDCQFAIRSGGHTAFAGAANMDADGVTLDLSQMSQVELSSDKSIAAVGSGARWGQVYQSLQPYNLAVSGGRVSSVGVGGLTLGGGKSFFAAQKGFACDNVRNFEVITHTRFGIWVRANTSCREKIVLACGRILQVNQSSYPDLYQALKGGSNNFGVVTRFDLETFFQGDIWAGSFYYNSSALDAGVDALYHLSETTGSTTNPPDEEQVIFSTVPVAQSGGGCSLAFITFLSYTAPTPFPPTLRNLTNLSLSNDAHVGSLTDFGAVLNAGTPNGQRYLFATATFRNDAAFMKELIQKSFELFRPLVVGTGSRPAVAKLVPATVLQPLTKAMLQSGCGKNSLGLCPSDGNLVVLDLTMAWADAKDDAAVGEAADALVDWTRQRSRELGLDHDYLYLNYANANQKPLRSYGSGSYRRLAAVARKYDADGVFQRLVPGGHKLW